MKRISKRQLPFATAAALTDTAKQAQDVVQGNLGRHFKLRNKGLKKAIAVKPADKRQARIHSIVGVRPWAKFLRLHALGGRKKSEKGHRVAIPTRIVQRTATGRIRKAQKPRRLRQRKGLSKRELAELQRIAVRGKRNAGVRITAKGTSTGGIFYLLRRSVRIRRTWPFQAEVVRTASANYLRNFRRRYKKAIAQEAVRAATRAIK